MDNDDASYDLGKKKKVGSGLKLTLWKREDKLVSSKIKDLDQARMKNTTNNACIKLKQQPIETDYSSNNIPIRVCADCNTTKTPLWRSGPNGPKVIFSFFLLQLYMSNECVLLRSLKKLLLSKRLLCSNY